MIGFGCEYMSESSRDGEPPDPVAVDPRPVEHERARDPKPFDFAFMRP